MEEPRNIMLQRTIQKLTPALVELVLYREQCAPRKIPSWASPQWRQLWNGLQWLINGGWDQDRPLRVTKQENASFSLKRLFLLIINADATTVTLLVMQLHNLLASSTRHLTLLFLLMCCLFFCQIRHTLLRWWVCMLCVLKTYQMFNTWSSESASKLPNVTQWAL